MKKIFLGIFLNKKIQSLEDILNDPIKSYQMMDKINAYKKSIENDNSLNLNKQIIGEHYSLTEV